jgi:hypothetical protein
MLVWEYEPVFQPQNILSLLTLLVKVRSSRPSAER